MEFKGSDLTNEKKYKKFKSQFDLVNFAINLAESKIRSGKEAEDTLDGQNITLDILSEIDIQEDSMKEILFEESEKATSPESTKKESTQTDKFRSFTDRKGKGF